jgi:hypothetical protein
MIQWWFFEREIGRERESCKKQNWDNTNVAGAEGDGFERERERERWGWEYIRYAANIKTEL